MNFKLFFKTFIITTLSLILIIGGLGYYILTRSVGGGIDVEELDRVVPNENQNIVVFGTDKSGLRSDVVMLFSVSQKDDTVSVMSIPRDTKMKVNGRSEKFNAALAIGGENYAIQKLKEITGVPIHDYVTVNFGAVETIIDSLGGVEFDVPQNMYYSDPYQDLYINLRAGVQVLNGKDAVKLLRFRQYPMGDIQRTEVQRDFIKACFEQKFKARYIAKLPEIYDAVEKNIKSSLTLAEAMGYVAIVKTMKNGGLDTYEMPYYISGDFVIPKQPEFENLMNVHFQ